MFSRRARFWLWSATVAALAAVFAFGVSGRMRVETDILAMLPQDERDPAVEEAVRALSDTTGQRTLFLIGAPEFAEARDAARALHSALQKSGVFARLQLEPEYRGEALTAQYAPYPSGLLSDTHRALLLAGQTDRLIQESLRNLYSPMSGPRPLPFVQDPFNLLGDFLRQQLPAAGRLQLREGVLTVQHQGFDYVLVTAEISGSPFSVELQQRVEPAMVAAIDGLKSRHPTAQVLRSGVIRHAAANSERATREIKAFGSASLIGVILLVLLTFRAIRPLLLTLASIGVGAMAGLTVCHFLFEKVHLVTLVFGSTLIGVSVDYSIHFFSDQFRAGVVEKELRSPALALGAAAGVIEKELRSPALALGAAQTGLWDPHATLKHVGPAILIGMLATALGYQAFLLPPFPGLRQIAVFSVTGIAASCACVLLWYPHLAGRRAATHQPVMLRFARRLESLRLPGGFKAPGLLLLLAVATLTALGVYRLQFVDDIRNLQSPPAWLQQEDTRTREILGGANDTRFFLVEGATPEALLQAEEVLRESLNNLIRDGELAGYQAVSRALPSQKRQAENNRLLRERVYSSGGALPRLLREAGVAPADTEKTLAAFSNAATSPQWLTPEAWLESPATAALRGLWLGPRGPDSSQGYSSAVTLAGIQNLDALHALDERLPQARFIDRVDTISRVLSRYRQIASVCLVGAYLVIGVMLVLRYGMAAGLLLLAAPVGAALLTLATLGLFSVPANLFNLLALLLVLGMGVDYSVFLREAQRSGGSRATVLMAIMLAGLMTLLSFGMLAFSATPFIRSIGLTVLLGVSLTFVLAIVCAAPSASAGGLSSFSTTPAAAPSAPANMEIQRRGTRRASASADGDNSFSMTPVAAPSASAGGFKSFSMTPAAAPPEAKT